MAKECFCTVSSIEYLQYVLTLYKSIKKYNKKIILNVCITDSLPSKELNKKYPNIHFFSINDIYNKNPEDLVKKYKKDKHKVRWSLKPILIEFLLTKEGYSKVIYVDSDIYFFNDYKFLFNLLNKHPILLTPHWRKIEPKEGFEIIFKEGFFNAGFVGASKSGLDLIKWWKRCCEYKMEKDYYNGLYEDQKYLDLLPLSNKEVFIIENKGCNVGNWNKSLCKRTKKGKNLLINEKYPLVFIHFTKSIIEDIKNGGDPLLLNYYLQYEKILNEFSEFKKKPVKKSILSLLFSK